MDLNIPIVNDIIANPQTNLYVPTSDDEVRNVLRSLKEPVTYFGEDNADRRQRLIKLVNEMPHENFGANIEIDRETEQDESSEEEEDFYTPGTDELLEVRKSFVYYSLNQSRKRIRDLQKDYEPDFIKNLKHRRQVNDSFKKIELYGSQVIPHNQRSISTVRYNFDSAQVGCGSWDGNVYLLDDQLNLKARLVPGYHDDKVSGLDWCDDLIITGANEGTVNIWDTSAIEDSMMKPKSTVKAHEARIPKTITHPDKQHFVTTSFDQTWKLWDLETCEEILQQEGHLREVFSGSFHPDGGILATGGLDALVKLWDLRSGRVIKNLSSHIQGVYCMDWRSNGYHLATGSGDSSIKIWDIRKLDNSQKELFSIPAHTKLVSDLKFYNLNNQQISKLVEQVTDENDENPTTITSDGNILISGSYDGKINIWSSDNWLKIKELSSTDKVMGCDISKTGSQIISCHWDKSIKLWQ